MPIGKCVVVAAAVVIVFGPRLRPMASTGTAIPPAQDKDASPQLPIAIAFSCLATPPVDPKKKR